MEFTECFEIKFLKSPYSVENIKKTGKLQNKNIIIYYLLLKLLLYSISILSDLPSS